MLWVLPTTCAQMQHRMSPMSRQMHSWLTSSYNVSNECRCTSASPVSWWLQLCGVGRIVVLCAWCCLLVSVVVRRWALRLRHSHAHQRVLLCTVCDCTMPPAGGLLCTGCDCTTPCPQLVVCCLAQTRDNVFDVLMHLCCHDVLRPLLREQEPMLPTNLCANL